MSNLFIVGNGFDVDHGMKTKYKYFHKFLQEKYELTDEDECYLDKSFDFIQDNYGDSSPTEREIARLFCGLVSKLENYDFWKDVEHDIGLFDYSECFDEACYPKTDMDDKYDRQRTHAIFNAEDRANEIYLVLNDIEPILRRWIETVRINGKDVNHLFESLINSNKDLFLNFNYTMTLERLYKCKNVCHIHGCVDCNEKLIIGHGNDEIDFYNDKHLPDSLEARSTLEELQKKLRKNTDEAIWKNKSFFELIKNSDITQIYSYGFSFSEIDLPYIEHICKCLDTSNVTWYLNDFNNEDDKNEFKKRIIQSGFKGSFDAFSV